MIDTLHTPKQKLESISWTAIDSGIPTDKAHPFLGLGGVMSCVHEEKMFVAGGSNFPDKYPWEGGKKIFYKDIYAFTIKGAMITHTEKIPFALPESMGYGAVLSTPQGLCFIGGENQQGLSLDKVFVLTNQNKEYGIHYKAELPEAMVNFGAVYYEGNIYVCGGENATKPSSSNRLWKLNIANEHARWEPLATMPYSLSACSVVLQKQHHKTYLYVLGGREKKQHQVSSFYASTLMYDFENNVWIEKSPMPSTMASGTAVAIGEEYILQISGEKGTVFNQGEQYGLEIANAKNETAKQVLIQTKNEFYKNLKGFTNETYLYNTHTDEWFVYDALPVVPVVTTNSVVKDNVIFTPFGEIRAGVRYDKINVGEIKFLVE